MEVNNTASETALTQELERQAEVVRDCALAATHHDRRKEQMALIDQPILIACLASSAPRTVMSRPELVFDSRGFSPTPTASNSSI